MPQESSPSGVGELHHERNPLTGHPPARQRDAAAAAGTPSKGSEVEDDLVRSEEGRHTLPTLNATAPTFSSDVHWMPRMRRAPIPGVG